MLAHKCDMCGKYYPHNKDVEFDAFIFAKSIFEDGEIDYAWDVDNTYDVCPECYKRLRDLIAGASTWEKR